MLENHNLGHHETIIVRPSARAFCFAGERAVDYRHKSLPFNYFIQTPENVICGGDAFKKTFAIEKLGTGRCLRAVISDIDCSFKYIMQNIKFHERIQEFLEVP